MPNYRKLKNLLDSDPDGRGWSGMNHRQIAADLAVNRNPGPREITLKQFSNLIGADITRRLIASMVQAGVSDALVKAWYDALVHSTDATINIHNNDVRVLLDSFVADSGLPLRAADATAIKRLSDSVQTDAEKHGLGFQPTREDIARVRG